MPTNKPPQQPQQCEISFLQQNISISNIKDKNLQLLQQQQQQQNSSRYKTELCRPFEEFNVCKYGDKCQFAHGIKELRSLNRHPKYKTELCRTFHTLGLCPYGHRCHFVHEEIVDINKILINTGSFETANAFLQQQQQQQQSLLLQALQWPHQIMMENSLNGSSNSSSISSSGGSSPSQGINLNSRLPVFWNF